MSFEFAQEEFVSDDAKETKDGPTEKVMPQGYFMNQRLRQLLTDKQQKIFSIKINLKIDGYSALSNNVFFPAGMKTI